jgi:hypothetical protein
VEPFDVTLDGHGTATLTLSHNPFDSIYTQPRVVDSFEALAPTPEPATMLLFATGVAALLLWKRRSHALSCACRG